MFIETVSKTTPNTPRRAGSTLVRSFIFRNQNSFVPTCRVITVCNEYSRRTGGTKQNTYFVLFVLYITYTNSYSAITFIFLQTENSAYFPRIYRVAAEATAASRRRSLGAISHSLCGL